MVSEEFQVNKPLPKVHRIVADGSPGIFLGRPTLNQLLAARGLQPPDALMIETRLAEAGALDGEFEYNGERGWLIAESWWSDNIAKRRDEAPANKED